VTDTDAAQAVRLAGRTEVIASRSEQECAYAGTICPSAYAAALAAVLRYLIQAGHAEALQVAVSEFDRREAQARQEERYHLRRGEAGFHSRTMPLASAVARSLPSGLKTTASTLPPETVSAGRGLPTERPVAGFHSRTMPLASAVARSLPSGLKATAYTLPPAPVSAGRGLPTGFGSDPVPARAGQQHRRGPAV
jgi:hypothetical protein